MVVQFKNDSKKLNRLLSSENFRRITRQDDTTHGVEEDKKQRLIHQDLN